MTATAARFSALGTYVHLATGDPAALDAAVALTTAFLDHVDRTCSRFRADSDLSRVNASPGRRVDVDPLLVAALRTALDAAAQSDGLVDPLLGRSLVTLGYDRDFRRLEPRAHATVTPTHAAWREVRTGPDWVEIPSGTALDLGSSGKAWASDLAVRRVHAELGTSALVSLGGDISVLGEDRWPVEVREHPEAVEPDAEVWVAAGGLATSSTVVRRWSQAGVRRHHLLDPRTGLPAASTWRTVTATGPTCVGANVATTAAIVLGAGAPAWLEARHVDARLVGTDGRVVRTGAWPEAAS